MSATSSRLTRLEYSGIAEGFVQGRPSLHSGAMKRLGSSIDSLRGLPVTYRFGPEESDWLEDVDALVSSPGVPRDNPLLVHAAQRGIEVLSEIELAYRFLQVPLVAITGTNGKSTTTRLAGEILDEAGTDLQHTVNLLGVCSQLRIAYIQAVAFIDKSMRNTVVV